MCKTQCFHIHTCSWMPFPVDLCEINGGGTHIQSTALTLTPALANTCRSIAGYCCNTWPRLLLLCTSEIPKSHIQTLTIQVTIVHTQVIIVNGVDDNSKGHTQIVLPSYREFVQNSEITEKESTPVGQGVSSCGRDTLDPAQVCHVGYLIVRCVDQEIVTKTMFIGLRKGGSIMHICRVDVALTDRSMRMQFCTFTGSYKYSLTFFYPYGPIQTRSHD